ncbi:hypothetical protein HY604_00425 [Candidatus Peregrinibacteria bacterium]|nr:hypothetical protein [Candidatus Peregrinibacteria bacterium]
MGILDWFKERPKASPQPPPIDWKAKAAAEAVDKERESLRKRLTLESQADVPSEADEVEPRKLEFKQLIYGKPVQSPDGPIVRGIEHQITGRSQGLSEDVQDQTCSPRKLFLDSTELDSDESYPWSGKDEGQTIKTTKVIDGKPYIVCARYRLRPEGGENATGRRYGQMHVIAIPAEQWSIAAIPQLDQILKAKPQTERDFSMGTVNIDSTSLDKRLPDGWFSDSVKEIISRIITGKSTSIQDWNMKIGTALDQFYYCLLCLPENISRRISFGAGLKNMQGGVSLGHGMSSMTTIRKVAGTWRGEEGVDFSLSKRYLEELEKVIPNCKTPRDVLKAIKNLPAELTASVEKSVYPSTQ